MHSLVMTWISFLFISLVSMPSAFAITYNQIVEDSRVGRFFTAKLEGESQGRVLENIDRKTAKHFGSGFLVSKSCLVTAGHLAKVFFGRKGERFVQFNLPTPKEGSTRREQFANDSDIYNVEILEYSMKNLSGCDNSVLCAEDWAVLKVKKNELTNREAGESNNFFEIGNALPIVGERINVLGYGVEKRTSLKWQSKFLRYKGATYKGIQLGNLLAYDSWARFGDSGSPLIHQEKVLGIHFAGINNATGESPSTGLLISNTPRLQKALEKCQSSED